MQISDRLRRFAAAFSMLLLCAAGSRAIADTRTQGADLVHFISFASTGDLTAPPLSVRGDLLLANDGNIYFSSSAGGLGYGTVAKLAPDGTLSVLYAFTSTDEGYSAYSGLTQGADGSLYGTTYFGGEKSRGTVFKVTLDGAFTRLYEFKDGKHDPQLPYAALTQAPDGYLYGTTLTGGDNQQGTIYRISPTGDFAVVHSFNGGDGQNPEGKLVLGNDGMLYGTTLQGGSSDRGVIYRFAPGASAGTLEVLYSFPGLGAFNTMGLAVNDAGANPRAGLMLSSDGNFYGTAYQGGEHGSGTVFRMTPDGTVSVVYAFTGPSFGAGFPLSGVVQDANGNLYGTTERGGYTNNGAAWRVAPDGTFTLLHGFTGGVYDGAQPYAGLLFANGALYGVSYTDLYSYVGALFKLDDGGGTPPVDMSVSETAITVGSSVTLTWNAPDMAHCYRAGTWSNPTTGTPLNPDNLAEIPVTGTESVTPPSAGIYTYTLSCTDAANVTRDINAGVAVSAPPLETVDGGGGAGGLSWPLLALFALLLCRKFIKETRSSCP